MAELQQSEQFYFDDVVFQVSNISLQGRVWFACLPLV
jgi:hypothetical protein